MEPLLKGYNAFITGAASGIGKAAALHFARHGASGLAITDIRQETLDALAATLAQDFPAVRVVAIALNVTSGVDVAAAFAHAVEALGRLDVAVNNAGIAGPTILTHETPEEAWRETLAVDLDGVFLCQKEELAVMMKQEDLGPRRGRGVIINTASLYGLRAPPAPMYQSAYTAAKHAVVGLTKSDGLHYARHGIRINAVCPGYVDTPLLVDAVQRDRMDAFLRGAMVPVQRLIESDEIADGIVFLASRMSSAMHASTLALDLGIHSSA
ncbi:NAD(P)-binding domain protein [Beauveria brongniartii RCEF 3172]|uniref:NAD(P)-binding domain protein n=1 Tax=Beauveria brongniartii RCEF 3172 TaxID=1081107 RepID=A0A167FX96_9HYPO|nr:NAD(P)-binding domain protein [Beauveria brongniartii RCEF 3172]